MHINPLLATDFYKADHRRQYPFGTTRVYSNFTPRSTKWAKNNVSQWFDDRIIFFGLQAFIKEHLIGTWNTGFFERDKDEVIKEYRDFLDAALGKDAVPIEHVAELHDLGYLPLEIYAMPEGSRVNAQVPLFTIENTHDSFFWLTNYLETWFSNELWKTCTTATTTNEYIRTLNHYSDETGGSKDIIPIQIHDFSCRGMSGMHDAAWSGMGHLLTSMGTDSMSAIDYGNRYYGGCIGVSVPATEHSVMCMGGQLDELETFRRLITDLYPSGIVSIVSDTWDFWQVITEFTQELKSEILNRTPNELGMAKTVFRPDSGDPVEIICGAEIEVVEEQYDLEEWVIDSLVDGYDHDDVLNPGDEFIEGLFQQGDKYYRARVEPFWNRHDKTYYYMDGVESTSIEEVTLTPEEKGAIQCLWDVFGGTTNAKGFKSIHERVGLIYGDSITLQREDDILRRLAAKGFASDNVVLGVGSYSYQFVTRDTYGMAMKATWGVVEGENRSIMKSPKTDPGKKSATGRMIVKRKDDGTGYSVIQGIDSVEEWANLLPSGEMQQVFRDGVLLNEQTFPDIQARIALDS